MASIVFKTIVTRPRRVGWVRFPHAPATQRRHAARLTSFALASLLLASTAAAQRADSARAAADTAAPRVQVSARAGIAPAQQVREAQPPISARRAFLYSLAMPGLGQSALRRPNAGAFYFGLEMLAIGMAIKSSYDLRLAKARGGDSIALSYKTDPATGAPVVDSLGRPVVEEFARNRYDAERIRARRTHFEDWIAFLVFNHLFSGADAFVSAQLWDLPAQVGFQSAPRGAALAFRVRF